MRKYNSPEENWDTIRVTGGFAGILLFLTASALYLEGGFSPECKKKFEKNDSLYAIKDSLKSSYKLELDSLTKNYQYKLKTLEEKFGD